MVPSSHCVRSASGTKRAASPSSASARDSADEDDDDETADARQAEHAPANTTLGIKETSYSVMKAAGFVSHDGTTARHVAHYPFSGDKYVCVINPNRQRCARAAYEKAKAEVGVYLYTHDRSAAFASAISKNDRYTPGSNPAERAVALRALQAALDPQPTAPGAPGAPAALTLRAAIVAFIAASTKSQGSGPVNAAATGSGNKAKRAKRAGSAKKTPACSSPFGECQNPQRRGRNGLCSLCDNVMRYVAVPSIEGFAASMRLHRDRVPDLGAYYASDRVRYASTEPHLALARLIDEVFRYSFPSLPSDKRKGKRESTKKLRTQFSQHHTGEWASACVMSATCAMIDYARLVSLPVPQGLVLSLPGATDALGALLDAALVEDSVQDAYATTTPSEEHCAEDDEAHSPAASSSAVPSTPPVSIVPPPAAAQPVLMPPPPSLPPLASHFAFEPRPLSSWAPLQIIGDIGTGDMPLSQSVPSVFGPPSKRSTYHPEGPCADAAFAELVANSREHHLFGYLQQ